MVFNRRDFSSHWRIIYVPLVLAALAYSSFAQQNTQEISLDSLLGVSISAPSKYWQSSSDAPASVTVVTAQDISRFGHRTLADVIGSVRGYYTSYDRSYMYAGVRGFGQFADYNDRILLLLNGHTLNENVYGSAPIGTDLGLTLDAIERIEFVRGAGSAIYGNNAMLSVINIVTKQGKALEGVRAAGTIGSGGYKVVSVQAGKEYDNGFDLFVSANAGDITGNNLYFPEFDTDSTNKGRARGLDWDRFYGFYASGIAGDFAFQAGLVSREKGIPTGEFGTAFNDPNTSVKDARQFIEARYTRMLTYEIELVGRAFADRYLYDGTYAYAAQPGEPAYLSLDNSQGAIAGIEGQVRWDTRVDNQFLFGFEHQQHMRSDYRLYQADTLAFSRNEPFSISSVFIEDNLTLNEQISLSAGLRLDQHSQAETSLNPRLALKFYPTKSTTLKLLYGTAFRAPNFSEKYYEDIAGGQKSNPDLRPESVRSLEIVAEHRLSPNLQLSFSAYNFQMSDLIDLVLDPADSMMQYQNRVRVKAIGAEIEIDGRFDNGQQCYASLTLQNAENADVQKQLSNSPRFVAKAGISFPFADTWRVSLDALGESSRLTVNRSSTPSYVVTNLTVLSPIVFEAVRVTIHMDNILDAAYSHPAGFNHPQQSLQQDGRTLHVKTEVMF